MKRTFIHITILATLPFLLTACFKTKSDIAREREEQEVRQNLQQNLAENSQTMEQLQSEIGRLQGKIDELEHVRKKDVTTLQSGKDNSEKAIKELQDKMEDVQKTQVTLFEEIKKLREENIQMLRASMEASRPAPMSEMRVASGAGASSGGGGKGTSFDAAMGEYKDKRYDSALEGFRGYIANNPKGKKLLDAHFMLGELLFRQKKYAEAVVEYSVPQEKSPKSAIGRKSTLKIAESFHNMGKNKDARAFAQLLIEGSPGSVEAKAAKRFAK